MARILVGIATHEPDQRFLESVPLFYHEASKKYDLELFWVWHKPLVEAQNIIAEKLMGGTYDYLLTLEDDHHGMTVEMLDSCIKGDHDVCGISYRSRHYPFMKIPMLKRSMGEGKDPVYGGSNRFTSGYHEIDLEGFGFTLFKKEVFNLLDKPYFQLNSLNGVIGPRATDINFSKRLQAKGVKLMGCYDHILPHRDIGEEGELKELLTSGIIAKHSLYTRLHRMLEHDRQMTKEKLHVHQGN